MTPPPLLPSLKYKKSVGNPIALPAIEKDDVLPREFDRSFLPNYPIISKYHRDELPNQSQTIVSNSVQAGLAA